MASRGKLSRLSERDQALTQGAEDLRGRRVLDRSNVHVGQAEDVLVDEAGGARFLLVALAADQDKPKVLLPVETIDTSDANNLYLNQPREVISGAPAFDEARLEEDRYWHELYDWYGFTPYWAPGYGAG